MPDSPATQKSFGFLDDQPNRPLPAAALLDIEDGRAESARLAESEAISSRYSEKLAERSTTKTMSPDYVAAQPTSMITKLRVTPEEQEEILFHYASTSSIPKSARLADVSESKVRAVVYNPEGQDSLAALRSAMRMSILRKIEETQTILLEALQNEQKLNDSSLTQISDVLREISEVQHNLLAATSSPSAFVTEIDPSSIYTGDELEMMAFLRRRLSAPATPLPFGDSAGPSSIAHSEADDYLETEFDITSSTDVDISSDSPIERKPEKSENDLSFLSEFAHQIMGPEDDKDE